MGAFAFVMLKKVDWSITIPVLTRIVWLEHLSPRL
jgi:hypothetical protein